MYNIIIVDDHNIYVDGLLSMLHEDKKLNIIFTANNGESVINYVTANPLKKVDLIISDIGMPILDGQALTKQIKQNLPDIKILIVSMYDDFNVIDQFIKYDVDGYLPKNTGKIEFLKAISTILNGSKYFSKNIRENYFNKLISPKKSSIEILSDREKDILRLIALERTTKEIAAELFLSTHTIESYRKILISKLDVRNMAGLTRYAIKLGLINIHSDNGVN